MYHSIILEDVLDLLNITQAYSASIPSRWAGTVERLRNGTIGMRKWLKVMCHPDGEISLFNDSAFGVAPTPSEIDDYALRLGLGAVPGPQDGVTNLAASGYIRLQKNEAVVIIDAAKIGPDYLPGHAHADTLSFEFSLCGRRVLVNSGTSVYGTGAERQFQRSTAAHNTVVVDGQNSSEVWAGFRVARRARPHNVDVAEKNDCLSVSAEHDGYLRLPGRVVHRRTWLLTDSTLTVEDHLGGMFHSAIARFHLAPSTVCTVKESGDKGYIRLSPVHLAWSAVGAHATLEPSKYHPKFGVDVDNACLSLSLESPSSRVQFSWA